jgi:hypothetical protein
MPAKTDYSRKTKWKNEPYRGERGVGGNFVYAGDNLLDKHLFVHRVAPGGFDWGPDASDEKASQLAIALLAPLKGVDYAVEHYHLFAENFVRGELTDDTWEIKRQDYRSDEYVEAIDGRDYPENTAPSPEDVPDLEDADLESITYAEEIALAVLCRGWLTRCLTDPALLSPVCSPLFGGGSDVRTEHSNRSVCRSATTGTGSVRALHHSPSLTSSL